MYNKRVLSLPLSSTVFPLKRIFEHQRYSNCVRHTKLFEVKKHSVLIERAWSPSVLESYSCSTNGVMWL